MDWKLPNGTVCQIDPQDASLMLSSRWRVIQIAGIKYVVTTIRKNGAPRNKYLHRVIMNAPRRAHVDHIDHDGLNNVRSNLRLCSRHENMRNQRKQHRQKTSRFKGVTRDRKRWRAQLEIAGKHISLGGYAREEEAARAYSAGAAKYFGDFAFTGE
jgi:hypothetical protein